MVLAALQKLQLRMLRCTYKLLIVTRELAHVSQPSLGVSSLDLGRSNFERSLFLCFFLARHATSAISVVRHVDHNHCVLLHCTMKSLLRRPPPLQLARQLLEQSRGDRQEFSAQLIKPCGRFQ